MIDAVIFDIDGTLIDSVDLHAQAWADALQRWGRDVTFAQVRHQIGKGGDQLLRAFFREHELEPIEEEISAWRARHFRENFEHRIRPFHGVRRLFERLRAAGKRIALATSAHGEELERYKEIAGIRDLLDEETSSDDVEKSKPHPDVFAAALAKLGVTDPSTAIAVGDTAWDAIAAGKAGLATIGVLCGGVTAAELVDAGCIAIYDDPLSLDAGLEHSPIMRGVSLSSRPHGETRAYRP